MSDYCLFKITNFGFKRQITLHYTLHYSRPFFVPTIKEDFMIIAILQTILASGCILVAISYRNYSFSCLAAGLQLYLYKNIDNSNLQVTSYERFNITMLEKTHIVWTMPQFIFLGVSEVLVGLTSKELNSVIS